MSIRDVKTTDDDLKNVGSAVSWCFSEGLGPTNACRSSHTAKHALWYFLLRCRVDSKCADDYGGVNVGLVLLSVAQWRRLIEGLMGPITVERRPDTVNTSSSTS